MNPLTRKNIVADRTLAVMMGVNEGAMLSYADLTKGIHAYIKRNNLKREGGAPGAQAVEPPLTSMPPVPTAAPSGPSITQPTQPAMPQPVEAGKPPNRFCIRCGAQLGASASFCHRCGAKQ